MSELKTNKVSPATGTALAVGDSGDTITVPSGATLDISASTLTPPATMPASSGVNFTALNATNLGSGTVPTARLGSGTADATTFLRGDNAWTAVVAGIGTASHWQYSTSIDTVDGENIFSGTWNEQNRVGSAMTVSSGVFTFPSTGIWSIRATLDANRSAASPYWRFSVYYTTNDGGAWTLGQLGSGQFAGSDGYCNIAIIYSFDVTDVSNYKVRFACELSSDNGVATTSSGPNVVFARWGDT